MPKNIKKLTLLHSNDMHGDFLPKISDGVRRGGVAMLSGYIESVREREKNVLYVISGDTFRGSLIDSEYKGVSTIEILNMLAPDCMTLGNHEVDYGIAHMLFVEKCSNFPIINANLYITTNHVRLFRSHVILNVDGMRILLIGILTDDVLSVTRADRLIGSFIDAGEAAAEVGKICEMYRDVDIDLTVVLTHIGFEQDKRLAAALEPSWGVDCIIGGHSHTFMKSPCVVHGVPIVQAGWGTSQIGRFDMYVNTDTNDIESYEWSCVPLENFPENEALSALVASYKEETDGKYSRVITTLGCEFTHPVRCEETQLGDLFADLLRDALDLDIMLVGSGSIRISSMGPLVEYRDLVEAFPYDDVIYRIRVSGAQLRRMIKHFLRDEAFVGHTEFYQYSSGVHIEYSRSRRELTALKLAGENVYDSCFYKIGVQRFHMQNFELFFGVPLDEISENRYPKVIASNALSIIDEGLSKTEALLPSPLTRIVFAD